MLHILDRYMQHNMSYNYIIIVFIFLISCKERVQISYYQGQITQNSDLSNLDNIDTFSTFWKIEEKSNSIRVW